MTNTFKNLNRDNGPLYLSLRRRLGRYMLEQGLKPGERFPSHLEIAKLAGVSGVTARLAVKQLERDGLLVSRGVRGTFIRQLPTTEQMADAAPCHRQVGVVFSQWDDGGVLSWNDAGMMPGILDAAAASGITVQTIPHELTVQHPLIFDRYIQERQVDGLIWLSMRYPEALVAARWQERGLPQVTVLNRVAGAPIPLMCEDNAGAASQAVRQLLAEGHQCVLVVHGGEDNSCYAQRLEGVRDELRRQGVVWPDEWFLEVPELPFRIGVPQRLEAALRQVKPTAVLLLAAVILELAEAGRAAGLEFGGNCRLISFHAPLSSGPCCTYFWPQLREIGQGAVALWQRVAAEFERDKQARPDWVESVPMETHEFSPPVAEMKAGTAPQGRRPAFLTNRGQVPEVAEIQ